MKKHIFSLILIAFAGFMFAQTITYNGSGNYILTEKTDLRRYDNGKYTGLVSKEVSSYISPVSYEGGYLYEGSFFVWENTVRASRNVLAGMDDAIPATFKINSEGVLTMIEDHGYPSFRSFPSYTVNNIKKGDKWQAKAERAVDPLNKGIVTKMPMQVEYQYLGDQDFHGEPCYLISAQWATRYGMGNGVYHIDWGGDKELQKATGSHKANIYVSKITGNALVIRDTVDETFIYADGSQIQFKGTISQFTEYPPALDRSKLIPALKRIAEISEEMEDNIKNKTATDDFGKDGGWGAVAQADEGQPATSNLANTTDNTATAGDKLAKTDSQPANSNTQPAASGDQSATTSDKASSKAKLAQKIASVNGTDSSATGAGSGGTATDNAAGRGGKADGGSGANSSSKQLVTVDTTPAGIRLTIPNLQFKPDSAELLNAEKDRLDKIAEVLKEVPSCKLLIEGHTAAVGKEAGELQLSKERAAAIAQALIARGVAADRIITKGSGGKKPIADNATAEGKAKNRRVEITILD